MLKLQAEVMAISWQGKPSRQEDSILIDGQILQRSGSKITPTYRPTDALCIAVADGVHNSPMPHLASKQVLSSVLRQHQADQQIRLTTIQAELCEALDHGNSHGASSTLALVQSVITTEPAQTQQLCIKHVGDSRGFHYQPVHGWQQLTEDHTTLLEVSQDQNLTIDQAVEYASIYNALNHYFVADWQDHNMDGLYGQFIEVQAGDWVLLSTDGMHDILPCPEWPAITQQTDLASWLKQLHDAVHRKGAYDNGSVIIVRWS